MFRVITVENVVLNVLSIPPAGNHNPEPFREKKTFSMQSMLQLVTHVPRGVWRPP